jgi:thioredoxin-like negative regulator of GroEL
MRPRLGDAAEVAFEHLDDLLESRDQAELVEVIRKPKLVFFYSPRSGRCRRVEAYLAQVRRTRSSEPHGCGARAFKHRDCD